MGMTTAILPAPRGEFTALSRSPQGRLFRKQILRFGSFAHPNLPGEKLHIDRKVAEKMAANFANNVCDIVQVPLVDDGNRHSEDPMRNIGEVVDLEVGDDGLYAVIDVRREDAADALGKTLIGASAMLHMNYTDTRTGQKVGPTLLHTAITNRPYITELGDFREIVRASADALGDDLPVVLSNFTSEDEMPKTKDELIAELRESHGIDVDDLAEKAALVEEVENGMEQGSTTDELVSALSAVLADAGVISLSGGSGEAITVKDVAEAVIELAEDKVTLSHKIEALEADREQARQAAAETEVDALVAEGKILPKQRDAMVALSLNDRETFEALVPDEALVAFSETGYTVTETPGSEKLDEDIQRLSAMANELAGRG